MDRYVTGSIIKRLREKKGLTQEQLADKLFVSSKAVSKWETGHGFPDISLLEPLAASLDISVIELLSGEDINNSNKSSKISRGRCYICPVCGNVIHAVGEAVISCCGITLPAAESEKADSHHPICVEIIDNEYYVKVIHPMSKNHYISFLAAVSDNGIQFVKLYSEADAEAHFRIKNVREIYAYCNRHGLFNLKL